MSPSIKVFACAKHCPFMREISTTASSLIPQYASLAISSTKPFSDIPTPQGLPFIGTLLDFIRSGGPSRVHEYAYVRHQTLGPIYREQLGSIPAVFISDPALMAYVFANEGKYPQNLMPASWKIYTEKCKKKRGLFFM